MTAEIPIWLLDIDGVLNAVQKPGSLPTHAWPADDWIDTKAQGTTQTWRILAARPVVEFIRTVHEQGRTEIRWHTTWQEQANEAGRVLGLPDFPVQEAPEYASYFQRTDRWWKLPAVWRVLKDEGRRVLWTDDDATWELRGGEEARLAAAGCHVVSPDPLTGLCRKHLRKIDEYLPTVEDPR